MMTSSRVRCESFILGAGWKRGNGALGSGNGAELINRYVRKEMPRRGAKEIRETSLLEKWAHIDSIYSIAIN